MGKNYDRKSKNAFYEILQMIQYIDKNALLARIKKLKMDIGNIFNEYDEGFWEGRLTAFDDVICALNTLEVREVDLPSNVDEAAESASAVEFYVSPQWRKAGENLFKAGAEWMAGQGVTIEKNVGQIEGIINNHTIYHNGFEVSEIDAPILNSKEIGYGDKVIVQVRKKGE